MEAFLFALLIILALLILFVIGWLVGGTTMLIWVAWFVPGRLRTPRGTFRLDVAVAVVVIWPVPVFLGFLRMVTWPARRLSEKRAAVVDPPLNDPEFAERLREFEERKLAVEVV